MAAVWAAGPEPMTWGSRQHDDAHNCPHPALARSAPNILTTLECMLRLVTVPGKSGPAADALFTNVYFATLAMPRDRPATVRRR
jgi:hypothetical protein